MYLRRYINNPISVYTPKGACSSSRKRRENKGEEYAHGYLSPRKSFEHRKCDCYAWINMSTTRRCAYRQSEGDAKSKGKADLKYSLFQQERKAKRRRIRHNGRNQLFSLDHKQRVRTPHIRNWLVRKVLRGRVLRLSLRLRMKINMHGLNHARISHIPQ